MVAIAVRDPHAAELPAGGLVQWQDAESGALLLVDAQRAAAQSAALRGERDDLQTQLRHCGVDVLMIDTERDWAPPLFALLRERRHRA